MAEFAQALSYLVTTMRADTALMAAAVGGVWEQFADLATPAPYALVVGQVPGVDALTMNAKRLFSRKTLQIKAVGPSSGYAQLVIIADRIDALFGSQKNIVLPGGGGVLDVYREQELAYGELRNGQPWSHLGGLYHLDLQGS